jgi:hypothetical protein
LGVTATALDLIEAILRTSYLPLELKCEKRLLLVDETEVRRRWRRRRGRKRWCYIKAYMCGER